MGLPIKVLTWQNKHGRRILRLSRYKELQRIYITDQCSIQQQLDKVLENFTVIASKDL